MLIVDVKRLNVINLREESERGILCHNLKYDRERNYLELYSSPAAQIRHKPFKTFNNVVTIEVNSYSDQQIKPDPEF